MLGVEKIMHRYAHKDIIHENSTLCIAIYSLLSKTIVSAPNVLLQAIPLKVSFPASIRLIMAEDIRTSFQHQPSMPVVSSVCWLARSLSNVVPYRQR
jgi:hypothetical protein